MLSIVNNDVGWNVRATGKGAQRGYRDIRVRIRSDGNKGEQLVALLTDFVGDRELDVS